MPSRQRAITPLQRYAAAVLLTFAAILVAILLKPYFAGQTPLTPFTIAVFLAAAYGGFGPGMLATLVSSVTIWALLTGPVFSPVFDRPRPMFFLISGAVISLVMERVLRTNRAIEKANRELSERSEALAKSNEELERFAYALSHDLQGPLRTVGAFSERLSLTLRPDDAESVTSLRFITEGVASMQAMIRGLLEYTTASKNAPAAARTDLNEVVDTVVRDLRIQVEESHAQVTKDVLPVISVDPTRIRQVFQNLIGNAIKYRSDRRPEVHVGAKSGTDVWILSVRDNGIGIDMQYAEKIFGLFERLHKDSEGTGIGLAVSRAIIERHGGKIWVKSEPGKGSTFFFTLPKVASKMPSRM